MSRPLPANWIDVADLRAQQAMAEVAQQVLWLTWAQVVLGVVGSIALFVTFWEARKATATALRALRVQQTAERAVITLKANWFSKEAYDDGGKRILASTKTPGTRLRLSTSVALTNRGKSPGLLRSTNVSLLFGAELPQKPTFPSKTLRRNHLPIDADEEMKLHASTPILTVDETSALRDGSCKIWLIGRVEYEDLFGDIHIQRFCYEHVPNLRDLQEAGGPDYWSNA